uniref:Uncharacterized protein n=1 Tax=Nelumbo nucifera TaxID=4432 RepID=A0A822ZQC7_NELNU|nr:TPA_asm: hypothetical protein HUJ06_003875 [Nelumbo nucifera]
MIPESSSNFVSSQDQWAKLVSKCATGTQLTLFILLDINCVFVFCINSITYIRSC